MPTYDWDALRLEYITDPDASYRRMAAKHGLSKNVISRRATQEQWPALRQERADARAREIEERLSVSLATEAETIVHAREQLAQRALQAIAVAKTARDMQALANTLQILSRLAGLQPALDEQEQRARINSIEARVGVAEEIESAGVIMLPGKDEEGEDGA